MKGRRAPAPSTDEDQVIRQVRGRAWERGARIVCYGDGCRCGVDFSGVRDREWLGGKIWNRVVAVVESSIDGRQSNAVVHRLKDSLNKTITHLSVDPTAITSLPEPGPCASQAPMRPF
jgi:hypothetical protein